MPVVSTPESRQLTILHILWPAPVGGLERVVHGLAAGHAGRGHRVAVLAFAHDARELPFLRAFAGSAVETHALSVSGRDFRRERKAVADACARVQPDVVHTHGMRPDVLDAPVARHIGIPTVTTVHGRSAATWKVRLYEWLQYRSFRRLDAVVAVSDALAAVLATHGTPRERVHVIPNGWTIMNDTLGRGAARRVLGIADDVFRVGWIGRLSAEKGADVFVDALARVQGPWRASIIGDGRERVNLEARIAALDIGDRVTLHGTVPDAERCLAAFDAFALSSRSEGMPMVLFEAMGAGVPIVATRVGGVPEVITDADARLVQSEDPAELAAALSDMRDDPDAAGSRAAAARARVAGRFGAGQWLDRYELLYRSLRARAPRVSVSARAGASPSP